MFARPLPPRHPSARCAAPVFERLLAPHHPSARSAVLPERGRRPSDLVTDRYLQQTAHGALALSVLAG